MESLDMTNQNGPLTEQIAMSLEDVQALLDSNRSLSIAFLSRRIRDIERDVRERFREVNAKGTSRLDSLEEEVKALRERLNLAGVKYREMIEELDKLKGNSEEA